MLNGQLRRLLHNGGIVAENLCPAQSCGRFFQQTDALLILVHQRPGGDHLRHRHRRAKLGADGAVRVITDPRHGCEDRMSLNCVWSQLHRRSSFPPSLDFF